MPDATHAPRSFFPEDMVRDRSLWPVLSDYLVSGKVETKRFVEFMSTHRDFAEWHFRRGEGRQRFN
jgi:hypothetical protein